MQLKILLPYRVFLSLENVSRIIVPTIAGSVGILPNRLDFASAITAGIICWQIGKDDLVYAAIDDGVMVKAGNEVLCSVHNAVSGPDLGELKAAVNRQFLTLSTEEQALRNDLAKMEGNLTRRLWRYKNG